MYKAFVTIISNSFYSEKFRQIKKLFTEVGFTIESEFPNIDWDPPGEYVAEIGNNLETRILIFESKMNKEKLTSLKAYSEDLEKRYSVENKRVFNINPGFLSEEGMFLLSHKPNESRERVPFGQYFVEKQYGKKFGHFVINKNTFSEYLGERIKLFNKLH